MTTKIAIRVDGSAQIGTGHVQRCLSLADALRRGGAEIVFVTRLGGDVVARLIAEHGFEHITLRETATDFVPEPGTPAHAKWAGIGWMGDAAETIAELSDDMDWVTVDHYAFDAHWHRAVANGLQAKIAVIDDLGDRSLAADFVIDHNPVGNSSIKYANSIGSVGKFLIGSRFALLGAAYANMPARTINPDVTSIGIFMGGGDANNLSSLVLHACRSQGYAGSITIASTSANPNLHSLMAEVEQDNACTLLLDQPNLAEFFAAYDLHIGAGGGASWERCCAAAPAIVLQTAANQSVVIDALIAAKAAICCRSSDPEEIEVALKTALASVQLRHDLSHAAAQMVDGKGCVRVAAALLRSDLTVRPAESADGPMIHQWRNDVRTRSVSRDPDAIDLEQHLEWFAKSLLNPDRSMWIGMIGDIPVGLVRFDRLTEAQFEVSIFLDPDLHALGLGSPLLRAGEAALADTHPGSLEIHAETLPENTGSQAMFKREGYEGSVRFVKRLSQQ
jgi:UDP-2,4-diacetamido-2,4,6-trideoxy-beta-L-altropyranose hydrolase